MSAAAKSMTLEGLAHRMGTVEATVDDHEDRLRLVERNEPGDAATASAVQDHEKRIREIEALRWKAAGIFAVLSILGSAFGSYIVKAMGG